MYKKMACLGIFLFVTAGFISSSMASDIQYHGVCSMRQKDRSIDSGTQTVTEALTFSLADQSDPNPQSREYKELKEELKLLMDEMKRLEKDIEKKILKKILPLIKREIEELRKRLREFRLEDDKSEPKKIRMKQPRKKRTNAPLETLIHLRKCYRMPRPFIGGLHFTFIHFPVKASNPTNFLLRFPLTSSYFYT